jgi:hypothetical protein
MRRVMVVTLVAACVAATTVEALARSAGHGGNSSSHYVSGYTTKNGVYVPPHHATNPNDTKLDNWSTRGNVNPYTGKAGTVDPYAPAK